MRLGGSSLGMRLGGSSLGMNLCWKVVTPGLPIAVGVWWHKYLCFKFSPYVQLIGLVKLSLHQFYLAYSEESSADLCREAEVREGGRGIVCVVHVCGGRGMTARVCGRGLQLDEWEEQGSH